MKKLFVTLTTLLCMAVSVGSAHADLDSFLSGLNRQASADRYNYGNRLSVQFETPLPLVQSILSRVESPADAFMCLQLGRMLNLPPERVLQTYRSNKGRGWGVVAKELGIKPGSAQFHALKRGDFALTGRPGSSDDDGDGGPGKGQGKGKGKGHNK